MQKSMMSAMAMVAVAGAAGSAMAIDRAPRLAESTSLSRFTDRGTGFTGTGFEASEGYVQGDITGQNGWLSNNPPNGSMDVTDGSDDGNGSPNALRLSVGPQAQGTRGRAQTPLFPSNSNGFGVDTRIDDNGGGNYGLFGAISTGGLLAFQAEFDYTGDIFVVLSVAGVPTFVNSNVSWAQNQYKLLEATISGGTLTYRYDGAVIGSSPVLQSAVFDFVQFNHDNFQAFGGGSFTPGGVAAGYFDNVTSIPAPGALALLGLGGLAVARRRRA
jgi:hypothetical protein